MLCHVKDEWYQRASRFLFAVSANHTAGSLSVIFLFFFPKYSLSCMHAGMIARGGAHIRGVQELQHCQAEEFIQKWERQQKSASPLHTHTRSKTEAPSCCCFIHCCSKVCSNARVVHDDVLVAWWQGEWLLLFWMYWNLHNVSDRQQIWLAKRLPIQRNKGWLLILYRKKQTKRKPSFTKSLDEVGG